MTSVQVFVVDTVSVLNESASVTRFTQVFNAALVCVRYMMETRLIVSIKNLRVVRYLPNMTETRSILPSETQYYLELQITEKNSVSSLPTSHMSESHEYNFIL